MDGRREEEAGYFCILTLKKYRLDFPQLASSICLGLELAGKVLSFPWREGKGGCRLLGRGGASAERRALPFKSSAQRGAATPKEAGSCASHSLS